MSGGDINIVGKKAMQKSDSDVGVAYCLSPDAALVAASLDLDSHVYRAKTSLPSQKHCDKYEAIGRLHSQDVLFFYNS